MILTPATPRQAAAPRSSAKPSSRRAVAASTSLSAGPCSRATRRARASAKGSVSSGSSTPSGAAPESQSRGQVAYATSSSAAYSMRAARASPADGQRALASARVGVDVAQVVHHQDRRGERTDRDRQRQHVRRQRERLHPVGSADGDDAEEEEDREVAEAVIAAADTGLRCRRGPPRWRARRRARWASPRPRPGRAPPRRGAEDGGRSPRRIGRRREQAELGRARRADASSVSAPFSKSKTIVGEVGADLEQQRPGQRRRGGKQRGAPVAECYGRRHHHRRRRRRQRAGPRREPASSRFARPAFLTSLGCASLRGPASPGLAGELAVVGFSRVATGTARSRARASRRRRRGPPGPPRVM